MIRMRPPENAPNVSYNGRAVPPEGIEVLDVDVDALLTDGWVLIGPVLDNPEG